ncbi:hypothetical protein JYT55_00020 [Mariprofundus ferrooxydans]|nr:hypothetical protein [Mariprofundus ferrooxydans]
MNWDLNKFRDKVVAKHGGEQLKLLEPFLHAIIEKHQYCSYHYHEANKLEKVFLGDDATSDDKFLYVFGFSDGKTERTHIDTNYLNIRASLSACLFSLHSISDTISHVVYYALGMNFEKEPINKECISILKVKNRLNVSQDEKLLLLLEKFDDDYLTAITNYSKHRSIICPAFTVPMEGLSSKPYYFYFEDFSYKGVHYGRRDAFDYLVKEIERKNTMILEVGAYFSERA